MDCYRLRWDERAAALRGFWERAQAGGRELLIGYAILLELWLLELWLATRKGKV